MGNGEGWGKTSAKKAIPLDEEHLVKVEIKLHYVSSNLALPGDVRKVVLQIGTPGSWTRSLSIPGSRAGRQTKTTHRVGVSDLKAIFFIMNPSGADLAENMKLVEEGERRPITGSVWPSEQFQNTYERLDSGMFEARWFSTSN